MSSEEFNKESDIKTSINDMPTEILTHLFSYFRNRQHLNIALVCRRYRDIIYRYFDFENTTRILSIKGNINLENIPERITCFSTRPIFIEKYTTFEFDRDLFNKLPDTDYFNLIFGEEKGRKSIKLSGNKTIFAKEDMYFSVYHARCKSIRDGIETDMKNFSRLEKISIYNYSDIVRNGDNRQCRILVHRPSLRKFMFGKMIDNLSEKYGYEYIELGVAKHLRKINSSYMANIKIVDINESLSMYKIKFDYRLDLNESEYEDVFYPLNVLSSLENPNERHASYFACKNLTSKMICYFQDGDPPIRKIKCLDDVDVAIKLFEDYWGIQNKSKMVTGAPRESFSFNWKTDIPKLIRSAGVSRKGSNSYNANELKHILGLLEIYTRGTKKKMLSDIFWKLYTNDKYSDRKDERFKKLYELVRFKRNEKPLTGKELITKMMDVWDRKDEQKEEGTSPDSMPDD